MNNQTIKLIKQSLNDTFKPTELDVIDDSHKHIGHPGNTGGGHYQVVIASPQFTDKPLIECHRMVYNSLQNLLKEKIHALQIHIKK